LFKCLSVVPVDGFKPVFMWLPSVERVQSFLQFFQDKYFCSC